ncbi:MAG: hypothetical protein NWQ48_11490 [Alishewanella sp.]|nr:hypothetical protein [Alishewanella sp.]
MKKISFISTFCILVFAQLSTASATTFIKGYACDNCSLQQAENIARTRGAPLVNCVPTGNNDVISIDEHACYSSPQKFIIFDLATNTTYPFQMSHSNQGSSNWDLILNSNPTTLTNLEHEISQDFFDVLEIQEQTLQEIAMSEEENLQLAFTPLSAFSASTFNTTTTSAENCESDTAATVIRMTLNPTFKTELSHAVNNQLRQRSTTYYKKDFEDIRFNQFGFQANRAGVGGLSIGWDYEKKSKLVSKYVFEPGHHLRPSDQTYYPARAAFKLSWNDSLDLISVEVEKEFTRVTSNLSLQDLLEDSTFSLSLSACAIIALQDNLHSSEAYAPTGAGGGSSIGIGDVPTGGNPNFPRPDPLSQSQELCKWHFYDKQGNLTVTIMGPCP